MVTSLKLYGTKIASSILATAGKLADATGGVNANANTLAGAASGWGECYGLGNAGAWAAAGAIGVPSGNGWFYETSLVGMQIPAGTWTLSAKVKSNNTNNMTATFTVRAWVYNSGVYTPIVSVAAAGATFSSSSQATFAATASGGLTNFNTGDKLYIDAWPDITSANASGTTNILLESSSTFAGIASQMELDTPGFQPQPTPTTPGTGYLRQAHSHFGRAYS